MLENKTIILQSQKREIDEFQIFNEANTESFNSSLKVLLLNCLNKIKTVSYDPFEFDKEPIVFKMIQN